MYDQIKAKVKLLSQFATCYSLMIWFQRMFHADVSDICWNISLKTTQVIWRWKLFDPPEVITIEHMVTIHFLPFGKYGNWKMYNHVVCLPAVTSFLTPLTEIIAPLIPFPSTSWTTPFIPRWTCAGSEGTIDFIIILYIIYISLLSALICLLQVFFQLIVLHKSFHALVGTC